MEKYQITSNTLAIVSSSNGTLIFENFIVKKCSSKAYDIIDSNCKYYGSSIQGRNASTNYLIGVKYKCPIIISELTNIIMIPTKSCKAVDCSWVNLKAIQNYSYNEEKDLMEITLTNDQIIYLNVTKNVFSNQVLKASRLESILNRKNR